MRKPNPTPPMAPLVLFLILAAGLFFGAVLARMMLPGKPHRFAMGFVADDRRVPLGNAADDPEAVDGCIPVLASNDTRPADVLASMVDKSLDVQARVTASDRTFTVDATSAVSDLTLNFNPPVTVPGGTATTIPLPPPSTATVHPTARIVCEVGADGVCAPSVQTPAFSIWELTGPAAGIAVRAEHQRVGPDEIRVDFAVKGAIDGGGVTGAGLNITPPPGFITFSNNKKTLAPFMGSARWRCEWAI